jgi:hypothetical protein
MNRFRFALPLAAAAFSLVGGSARAQSVYFVKPGGSGKTGNVFAAASAAPGAFPVGKWVHVVLAVDRLHAQHRVFIDGRDVTKTDHFGRPDSDTATLPLAFGPQHTRDGRLYNEVLRPGEIARLARYSDTKE